MIFVQYPVELDSNLNDIYSIKNLTSAILVSIGNDVPAQTEWRIYTDGSKSKDNVECAYAVYKDFSLIDIKQFKLFTICNVFQLKVFAILRASEYILNVFGCIDANSFKIISDSKSAQKAISNFMCQKSCHARMG